MWHFDGENLRLERILESKLFGIVVPNEHAIGRYYWIVAARHDRYQIRSIEHLGYGHAAHFVRVFVF